MDPVLTKVQSTVWGTTRYMRLYLQVCLLDILYGILCFVSRFLYDVYLTA